METAVSHKYFKKPEKVHFERLNEAKSKGIFLAGIFIPPPEQMGWKNLIYTSHLSRQPDVKHMNYCVFANQGDFQIQIEQFLKRLYKSSLRTITSKVKGKAFIKFFRFRDIFILFATFPFLFFLSTIHLVWPFWRQQFLM